MGENEKAGREKKERGEGGSFCARKARRQCKHCPWQPKAPSVCHWERKELGRRSPSFFQEMRTHKIAGNALLLQQCKQQESQQQWKRKRQEGRTGNDFGQQIYLHPQPMTSSRNFFWTISRSTRGALSSPEDLDIAVSAMAIFAQRLGDRGRTSARAFLDEKICC